LTAARARVSVIVAASLLMAILASFPSRADTAGAVKATRAKLASLQSELDRLAGSYADALTHLALTEAKADAARADIQRLRSRMLAIQARLATRARDAYESGGADTLELLLTSDSFSQFSDRVEFLGRVTQGDTDLLLQARVTGERLRRAQRDLEKLSREQAATAGSLRAQKSAIASAMTRTQAVLASLQKKLAAEQAAAAAGPPIRPGGILQACPVGQPRAFVDTFGAPRPGGRTHLGIDLMAPLGTPIYAAQPGRFVENSNSLGGITAVVFATNGDYTYYAHLSSYAGVGSGTTVGAGTMIGHVGNTGDAAGGPYHLHFEYHPGGGGAVDPYDLLRAACG